MRIRFGQLLVAAGVLLLSACGEASDSEIESALEVAWTNDSLAMAQAADVELPGVDPGALRGIGSTARVANNLAQEYGGKIGGSVASGVINEASRVASDFGIDGADELRKSVGMATATDWSVRNMEVLSKRKSGEETVAMVRYDLDASINGVVTTLAKDVTHKLRIVQRDGGWKIEQRD